MTTAALYHWRIKPGREAEFASAWEAGTRLIHQACGSYGAILHRGADGLFWSYASWPDEATRQKCFAEHDWFSMDCFKTMQDCVAERFDEVTLEVLSDQLGERRTKQPPPLLTTPRLLLRPIAMSDAEALAPALMDTANMRYWSRGPLESLDAVREYISWNVHSANVDCFVACVKTSPDQALGWCSLIDDRPKCAEIGFIFRPDAHGKGYAFETVSAVIDHAMETQRLRRLFADVDPDNHACRHLLERLKFKEEARLTASWETHIGVRDAIIYARLNSAH